jgi:hypothetical protein
VLVDDVVHPALAHALHVTRTSRPPGAVAVKEHVVHKRCEKIKKNIRERIKKCQREYSFYSKVFSRCEEEEEQTNRNFPTRPTPTRRIFNTQKRTVVRGQIARLEDFLIAEGILHVFVQVFSAHDAI